MFVSALFFNDVYVDTLCSFLAFDDQLNSSNPTPNQILCMQFTHAVPLINDACGD